jgi:signal transduction histidine kinase
MVSVTARATSMVRRVPGNIDLQAFRLFVPAYLLVHGTTLTILPGGALGDEGAGQSAFGVVTVVSGLALLWLGAIHLARRRAAFVYATVALLQAGYGLFLLLGGDWVPATTHLLVAAGILLLAPVRVRARPQPNHRPDLLVVGLGIANAIQGLALVIRRDASADLLVAAGVQPEPFGLVMLVAALAVIALQVRGSTNVALDWLAAGASGLLLLAIVVLSATRVDRIYWYLGMAVYLRAGALLSHPIWQPRAAAIDWHSIRTKIAAALVTAATLPLFAFVVLELFYASSGDTLSPGGRRATFGVISLVLLSAYGIAWWWGAALSRAHTRVAAAVSTLQPGDPWLAPEGRLDPELRTITDTVERLSGRLAEEKAAAERRLAIAAAGEIALSSSLNLEVAAERLLDTLVPAFCDSAVVYVREGDAMRRLALKLPPGIPISDHAAASGEGMGPDIVFATGQPQLYFDGVPPDYYAGLSADPEHERLINALSISSLMLVPIVSTHGVLGVLSAALHGRRRRFHPADAAALQDLAARAALSIENARLFEELARASAVKDEFLGLISHELKTPMTTILGNALLLRRIRDEAARDRLLDDLEADAERMAGIVDNLLSLARFEVVQRHLLEPTALHAVVRRCVADIARAHPDREITAEADGRPVVEANAEQLEMVIRNLVGNALKYSPPGSPVRVEVRGSDDRATVLVLDRGPGIDDDDADQLFDAFFRSGTTDGRVEGLGIGLAVCRRIVESLGGGVSAARRAGGGSIFSVWLPIMPVEDVGREDELVPVPMATPDDSPMEVGRRARERRGPG